MKKMTTLGILIALMSILVVTTSSQAKPDQIPPIGKSIVMESGQDSVIVNNDSLTIPFQYPQIRHVSLTLVALSLQSGDVVQVQSKIYGTAFNSSTVIANLDTPPDGGVTVEFDTEEWQIVIISSEADDLNVSWAYTVTYQVEN